MPRRAGSKNRIEATVPNEDEDPWWDEVSEGEPIIQWTQYNDEKVGVVLADIVEAAAQMIDARLKNIDRLHVVSEFDADLYTVKALEELAAIRTAVDWGVHVAIDASLARGRVSERKLAQAAGISNHTVKQWKSAPVSFVFTEDD